MTASNSNAEASLGEGNLYIVITGWFKSDYSL